MIFAECPVCQEILHCSPDDALSALKCGHIFHWNCIDTWFKTSSTCPQCRVGVTKRQIVKRLFFSELDKSSCLPLILDSNSSISSNLTCNQSRSLSHSGNALKFATSEVTRLTNKVAALEDNVRSSEQKLSEKTSQLDTVYKRCLEADKLHHAEAMKRKQLTLEIAGYKQLLQEAESIKAESLELRRKMDEMTTLKALLDSTDMAAEVLFKQYLDDNCNREPVSSVRTLCKWAAVLRQELSAKRAKVQKYRLETQRLRKIQADSISRVHAAESEASNMRRQIARLQGEIATAVGGRSISQTLTSNSRIRLSGTENASTPLSNASDMSAMATPSHLGMSGCLKYVDLGTPETNALLYSPPTSSDRGNLITPRQNPFGLNSVSGSASPIVPSLSSNTDDKCVSMKSSSTSTPLPQRRPSSIYQLALLRNYNGGCGGDDACSELYNGLGCRERKGGQLHTQPPVKRLSDKMKPLPSQRSKHVKSMKMATKLKSKCDSKFTSS